MSSQSVFRDARVEHVRELKNELSKAREELHAANAELESLKSHLALATLSAMDAMALPADGSMLLVDGWNVLLTTSVREKEALFAKVRRWLGVHGSSRAWIVFDGPRENSVSEGRMRASWTGGDGEQRADRMIVDYIHTLRLAGAKTDVMLVTGDKLLAKKAKENGVGVIPSSAFVRDAMEEK